MDDEISKFSKISKISKLILSEDIETQTLGWEAYYLQKPEIQLTIYMMLDSKLDIDINHLRLQKLIIKERSGVSKQRAGKI